MSVVYLDYNVIASSVGIPPQPDGAQECEAMLALKARGDRFALSAWTAFELARSQDAHHVRQCCDLVERLDPLWMSDARYLIAHEIARFLARLPDRKGTPAFPAVRALNGTIAQMWFTYGVRVVDTETFRNCVQELRSDSTNLRTIISASAETARAIITARDAYADGRSERLQPVIDRDTYAKRLSCGLRDERIEFLIANQTQFYEEAPISAVEDALANVRARDSFAPRLSHAADFQHAMAALAYCGSFVTRDGQLAEHCRIVIRQLRLQCRVFARVGLVAHTPP